MSDLSEIKEKLSGLKALLKKYKELHSVSDSINSSYSVGSGNPEQDLEKISQNKFDCSFDELPDFKQSELRIKYKQAVEHGNTFTQEELGLRNRTEEAEKLIGKLNELEDLKDNIFGEKTDFKDYEHPVCVRLFKDANTEIDMGDYSRAVDKLFKMLENAPEGAEWSEFVTDAIKQLEDVEKMVGGDENLRKQIITKAKQSLRRVRDSMGVSMELGRVRKPNIESPKSREIYRYLKRVGKATLREMADFLDVSKQTVRKRLKELLEKELVRKIETKQGEPNEYVVVE